MKVLLILAVLFALSAARDINKRIVNGQDAEVRDFPHVLALYDQGRYGVIKLEVIEVLQNIF